MTSEEVADLVSKIQALPPDERDQYVRDLDTSAMLSGKIAAATTDADRKFWTETQRRWVGGVPLWRAVRHRTR